MAKIDSLRSIDGFLAGALVDSSSGMVLESIDDGKFPVETAAAFNTQVVQAKLKAMDAIGLGDDKIEDILISLGTQYHLIRPLASNREIFIYIALNRKEANLGMARAMLKNLEGTIKGI
jgi:predicted regulator of Ras-like GTPase activity (Roadblock/LC7/MglB family)